MNDLDPKGLEAVKQVIGTTHFTNRMGEAQKVIRAYLSATVPAGDGELVAAFENHQWPIGLRVTKTKGAAWTGRIVGYYTTELTPVGYAVESENEPGSVQIYPVAALSRAD